jgi:hypothetical protein
METSSQVDHANRGTNKKTPNKINFFIGFVIFSFILAFIIGGIYFGKHKSSKQAAETNIQEQVKITKKELPDTPDKWQTYQLKTLGMELKLPGKLAKEGDWKTIEKSGDKGAIICFSNDSSGSGSICNGEVFILGSTSVDFQDDRGTRFSDVQGFENSGNKIIIKSPDGEKAELNDVKFRGMKNQNGVKIIKILGGNPLGENQPRIANPGEGYLGAVVNTNNPKYPGVTIQLKIDSDVSEYEFDQILDSIKFTN